METSGTTPPVKHSRFRVTRIALVVILAGLWVFATLEWPRLAYRWNSRGPSPHPEIGLRTLEPRFGILSSKDALVANGRIIWERKMAEEELILTPALGESGEPAVRLFVPEAGAPGRTVGYAVREEAGWQWLTADESAKLEAADRERRTRPREGRTPSLTAPKSD